MLLAAINLVLFHYTHVYAVKFGYSSPLGFEWPYGPYGVEMFFILSGFVNSMSLLRRGQPADFVAARLIRIVPFFMMAIVADVFILRFGADVRDRQHWTVPGQPDVDPTHSWSRMCRSSHVDVADRDDVLPNARDLVQNRGLRRYFLSWGTLLTLSLIVCPTLDSLQAAHASEQWFGLATAFCVLLLLDFVPLFTIGFLLYAIKTGTGKRWQNIIGIIIAACVFHSIDHGKHNPAATVLIIGLVTLCAYGKVPPLRIRPLVYVSTISYALYPCHNNLGSALINCLDQGGVPPQICFVVAMAFAFSLSIIVTNRIEAPMTRACAVRGIAIVRQQEQSQLCQLQCRTIVSIVRGGNAACHCKTIGPIVIHYKCTTLPVFAPS